MSRLKKSPLTSLLLPITLCTLLEAKDMKEANCIHTEATKKVKGCMVKASFKGTDAQSKILNRLNEMSLQLEEKSISKENSIEAIEKLVYAAGKIHLTKNEIKITQLDKEISISKFKNIEIINKLVYRKKNMGLTKEEIKLMKVDKEIAVSKNKKLNKLVRTINNINDSSIVKSSNTFILIKVKKGDTLQSLANHYYGDKKKYTLIYKENKDKIGKNLKIFSNTVLIIPNIKRGGKIIDS